jgi:uncharacterized membrane protein HdeD (DUF308 family)
LKPFWQKPTMNKATDTSSRQSLVKYWWINLIRGAAALFLGLGLILGLGLALDEMTLRSMLSQFIGIYLLGSGIMSFIWGFSNRKRWGLWFAAGTLGLLGGLAFIARPSIDGFLSPTVLAVILGTIIVLTGVAHILGGFRTEDRYGRKWAWEHFFLGLIEIGMGLVILASPILTVQVSALALSAWGLIAGIGLIADAIRLRRTAKELQGD